jgi:hypothetical protein
MAKALMVIGGVVIIAVVAAYPDGAVLAVVLAIVWWLTDPSVAVSRSRGSTWFDRASDSVGGWHDADQVAAAPEPDDEPPTAEVVVKGARRADPRRVH